MNQVTRRMLVAMLAVAAVAGLASRLCADEPEAFKVQSKTGKCIAITNKIGTTKPATPGDLNEGSVTPSEKDKAKGYILFTRLTNENVHENTLPRPEELAKKLSSYSAWNKFEPMSLGVVALKELEIQAALGDLAGPSGAKIAADQIDIRYATQMLTLERGGWMGVPPRVVHGPFMLEKLDKASLKQGQTGLVWITVYVDPKTPAGKYTGTLKVSLNDKQESLPVEFDVLPIKLVAPARDYIMSHPGMGMNDRGWNKIVVDNKLNVDFMRRMFVDEAAHGFNRFMIDAATRGVRADKLTDAQVMKIVEQIDEVAQIGKQTGVTLRDIRCWNSLIAAWDKKINWYVYYPFSEELDEAYAKVMTRILEEGRKRGWPDDIKLVPGDEPGGHPATIPAVAHYLEVIKTKVKGGQTLMSIGGGMRKSGTSEYDALSEWLDMPNTSLTRADLMDKIRKDGKKFEIYNGASLGEPAKYDIDRHRLGFFAARVTADAVEMWCYQNYVCYDEGVGPVPSINWEMLREGVDDGRYVATLDALIAKADKGDAAAKQAAKAARAKLDGIYAQINPMYGEFHSIDDPPPPDAPKPGITAGWRKTVVEEILKLQKLVGDAK